MGLDEAHPVLFAATTMRRRLTHIAIASGVLLAMLGGCRSSADSSGPVFRNVTGTAEYLGNAACVVCHEQESAGFAKHGMGRSMVRLTTDRIIESYPSNPVVDEATGLRYRALLDGGQPVQEETLLDESGQVVHRIVRPMDIVMGSGNAARTYFTSDGGWLMQLPLTWYTQSGRWAFSPGYDVANRRFGRALPDRCMACHNGIPVPVPETNGQYVSFPDGITCERCHGPGSVHVDERQAVPEPDGPIDDTIVNPRHLPFDRRMDVCEQCHLNGTVSLLREDRTAYGYLPGQPLASQIAVYFEPSAGADDIAVISHVERLEASACFAGANGDLECTTCHDPHAPTPGPEVFGAVCLSCHAGASLPDYPEHVDPAGCTSCHMPKVEAEETPHASFTDHRIRVVDSEEGESRRPDELLVPYFERDRGSAGDEARGMALVVLGRQRGDQGMIQSGRVVLSDLFPDIGGEASLLLGLSFLDEGNPESAIAPLEAALVDDPDRVERLNALAQAYQATGRTAASVERLYRQALRIQPARADVRLNYGQFLEHSGRTEEALDAYRLAAEEAPWRALAEFNTGSAEVRAGRIDEAGESLLRALHLDPTLVEAWGNLGALYAQEDRMDSARVAFERGVQIAPGNSLALANLGAFYVNQEMSTEAIPLLRDAVAIRPDYVDALANLALAYFRVDSLDEARTAASRAVAIDPGNALARQVMLATE